MRVRTGTGLIIGTAALAACATTPMTLPIQATRYHYDPMADRGTILVEPSPDTGPPGPEYRAYADAVQAELLATGYTGVAPGATPQYLVTIAFTRQLRALPRRRSPVTVGIGGGTGGYGGGVGGGVSFPIGGGGAREGVATELSVRIRRGPDALWEGKAQALTVAGARGGDADAVAARLARALFTGFPGDSGRTIEVK